MSSSENEDIEIKQESSEEEEQTSAQEEDDESGAEAPDINASATESDEDDDDSDEVDDDEDIPAKKEPIKKENKTKKAGPRVNVEKITSMMKAKNEKRIGKQLYIRFPEKLPEKTVDCKEMVKALSDLIVEVHRPRQKHARFCLVDFKSKEDRDKALEEISKNDKKIVVSLPKVDNEDFLKKIIEKKIRSSEAKLAKNLLRKESKKLASQKEYTSTLMVLNIPKGTTVVQIKELFPDAVDIQTKPAAKKYAGQMVANITMPTTADAKSNIKRKLEINGKKLLLRFFNTKKKGSVVEPKKEHPAPPSVDEPMKGPVALPSVKPKKRPLAPPSVEPKKGPLAPPSVDEPKKGPLAPEPAEEKTKNGAAKPAAKKPKQSVPENGSTEVTKQKVKKPFPPHKAKPEVKKPFPPNKGIPGQNKQPAAGKQNKQKQQKKNKAAAK